MKTLRMVLGLCVLFSFLGLSASGDTPSSKVFPYPTQVKELPNGLKIVVVRTDYPNIVSLQIPVQVGSRNEVEPGKSGFAHFFEHMMFRGTEKYPSQAYNEVVKNAGADGNAFTSDDLTNYHLTFSKEDLETIIELEADRFQNLKYSTEDFKTESKAVLGEYNKNASDPQEKLIEVQRDLAFQTHTYKHTTMGFLKDVLDMPNQLEYSHTFFDRYYRPQNVIILVTGDVVPSEVFALVEKYWGAWKRGTYSAKIPTEPQSTAPVYAHVTWETKTLPWITVAFHGPAFSDTQNHMATMNVISKIAFSESSPLYQKLVVNEQKVDQLFIDFSDHKDPYLLTVAARVKDVKDVWTVRDEILNTLAKLRTEKISAKNLATVKANMKYSFVKRLDNSEAIAESLVYYLALTRDPETLNRVYSLYDSITPGDIQSKANTFLADKNLVVVSLSSDPLPKIDNPTGSIDVLAAPVTPPTIETVLTCVQSPITNFRILFNVGSADDPTGKEGLAQLTAALITDGGSESMSYSDIQKALYPMAASFTHQVDKEMTVFMGTTHKDNLDAYSEIILDQLLHPRWDPADFTRVKTNLINAITVNLRGNNDEELGKEVLYENIYKRHPYGHLNLGHVKSLQAITLQDVKQFYNNYTLDNLVLGIAGECGDEFIAQFKKKLLGLPDGPIAMRVPLPAPEAIQGLEAEIIQKDAQATAISLGFPIEVTRDHPDFVAMWLMRAYLGEHRSFVGRLMNQMRGIRGLNYGDYAYIEYFPRGMFQFHPDSNLGREQQIFQIWIRPVETIEHAHFAVRIAMVELNKLINNGLSPESFTATKNYLTKFVNLLTKKQDAQLGYALDSRYYRIEDFVPFVSARLKKLTVEDVNQAIKKHLQDKNVKFVFITPKAEELRTRLINNTVSPITYNAEKPPEVLEEDKIIEKYPLDFKADKVTIRAVDQVFVE